MTGNESRKTTKTAEQLVAELKVENRVSEIIRQIGIPAHIKGYRYVRYAICLLVQDYSAYEVGITKVLYPAVAEEFSTTSSKVERAIRHAIEVGWERGDIEALHDYFGYTIQVSKGKPTNSEFIADRVLQERKSEN